MKYAALVLILIASFSVQARDFVIKKGVPFAKARFILLVHDWKPVAVDIESERIGVENQLIKKKIFEIESCSIDQPLCIFNYQKTSTSERDTISPPKA